jgi:hypothetical protein
MNFTPDNITKLKKNEVFVFGSNLEGRHGAGAAKTAVNLFGAKHGRNGLCGQSYALPTVGRLLVRMHINDIKKHAAEFLEFARKRDDLTFYLTEVGCGLAGHSVNDIAPLFRDYPSNVIIPKRFYDVLLGLD